jgi:hypothetical protein
MATSAYVVGRKRYQRPQAMLWSNNPGTLVDGLYVPTGYEIGSNVPTGTDPELIDQFLILSDHNRNDISFSGTRIEQRQRTVNGRMRSHHIADKLTISTSWNNLPSRRYSTVPDFDLETGISPHKNQNDEYTSDGGAGGVDILDWYKNHTGSFWLFLSYDNYSNFGNDENAFDHLGQYSEILEVFIADFNYSVIKRGGSNFDLWNISVTLEEA